MAYNIGAAVAERLEPAARVRALYMSVRPSVSNKFSPYLLEHEDASLAAVSCLAYLYHG
jgi:hypothetical protein